MLPVTTLLAALVWAAHPPPPTLTPSGLVTREAASPGCLGQVLHLDLARYRQAFLAELTPVQRAADLRVFGLDSDYTPPCATPSPAPAPALVSKQEVFLDLFQKPLFAPDSKDWVLQFRGNICEVTLVDGVVLHPLGKTNTYCALPMPFLPGREQLDDRISTSFGFKNLTDARRVSFSIHSKDSASHSDGEEISYWDIQAGRFVQVFKAASESGSFYTSSQTGSEDEHFKVSTSGPPPQVITLEQSSTSCKTREIMLPNGEAEAAPDGRMHCTHAHSTQTFCYVAGNGAPPKDGREVEYDLKESAPGVSRYLHTAGCQ